MGNSGDKKHKHKKRSRDEKEEEEEAAAVAAQGKEHKKRKRDKEGDEGSGRRKKKDRKRKESRKHKEGKKEKKGKEDKGVWAGGASHEALVKLLAAHPGVVEELVLVLRALEAGQGVALDGIPLPDMRKRMGAFLATLGLRTELQGLASSTTYYLTAAQEAEKDPLLQRTLRAVEAALGKKGLSPAVLAAEERMAVLLAAYPALGEEVQSLLLRVLAGETVVLSGLDDTDLRTGLEGVLSALGLEFLKEGEEEGYALPSSSSTTGKEGQRVAAAEGIGQLLRLFAKKGRVPPEAAALIEEALHAESESAPAAAAGAAAGGGGKEGKEKEGEEGKKEKRVVRGPAMPDAAMLAEAGRMMEEGAYAQEGEEEESSSSSEDDVVGPSLGDGRQAVPDEIAYRHIRKRQAAAMAGAEEGGGREEWMSMAPDELTGQDNSHMDRLRHTAMTSQKPRGFSQRSERNRLSNPTGPAAPRNAMEAEALRRDAEEAKKNKSLLEKHQEKVSKEEKAAHKARAGKPPERVPWSRELMEGRKEMGKGEAGELFKMAQELGTRFSRTFR